MACHRRGAAAAAAAAGRRARRNERFYEDGAEYLGRLRRQGRTDYPFEDEFYYTMPAVSSRPGT